MIQKCNLLTELLTFATNTSFTNRFETSLLGSKTSLQSRRSGSVAGSKAGSRTASKTSVKNETGSRLSLKASVRGSQTSVRGAGDADSNMGSRTSLRKDAASRSISRLSDSVTKATMEGVTKDAGYGSRASLRKDTEEEKPKDTDTSLREDDEKKEESEDKQKEEEENEGQESECQQQEAESVKEKTPSVTSKASSASKNSSQKAVKPMPGSNQGPAGVEARGRAPVPPAGNKSPAAGRGGRASRGHPTGKGRGGVAPRGRGKLAQSKPPTPQRFRKQPPAGGVQRAKSPAKKTSKKGNNQHLYHLTSSP